VSAGDGFTLRAYAPGDESAIQRAFAEVFRTERSLAEWRWKFLEPPRGSRILLAFDGDGELACQYAAIAVDVDWGGEPMQAAQIVDVFSRRRRGLGPRGGPFQRTMERFLSECAGADGAARVGFVYGFPGERHQRAGVVTGHYSEPAPLERLQRAAAAGRGRFPVRHWISEGFDAHATDRLWRRSRERYSHATVRNAAWFQWRYERRPGGRYLHLGLRRAGETRAWAVVALGGGNAHWVDLVWDGERAADLADLAAAVTERSHAHASRPTAVDLWLRGDREAKGVLLEEGFESSPEPVLRLSAIAFDPRVTVPQVLSGLYLTMGDSDHF
jgi:hypothetical protein